MARKLSASDLKVAKKALRYYDEGTPLKDAFEDGAQEQRVLVESLRIAVEAQT